MSRCNYPYSWRLRQVICTQSCNPYPPSGIPEEGTAFGGEKRFSKEKKKNKKEREKEKEEKDKDFEEEKESIDLIEKERKESFGEKDEETYWDRRDKNRKEKRKDGETIGDEKNLRPTKLQRAPESYSLQPVASWSTFDDQDWLFPSNERPQSKSKFRVEEDTSEEVWTEAVYLSAVDMYALPYVNPWFLPENGKKK